MDVADDSKIERATLSPEGRLRACGKFLYQRNEKVYVRGVTYGTFRPDAHKHEYPERSRVENDFATMAAQGVNAVRVYTVPPLWVLDLALEQGLRVMIGMAMERYIGYLTDRAGAPDLAQLLRQSIRQCARHPAVLCYALANEIPAPTVRWLGAERTERFLERLYRVAKEEDPEALVTYVNYPSTEYLRLPFLDVVAYNVYLETEPLLKAYLARLQNLADDRPLLMSEIGLDSRRNGEQRQSEVLSWQLRTAFRAGCAGAFVYAWTDEWHRGGEDVHDWDFGLTRRDRQPKPALEAVSHAFSNVPFRPKTSWPRISVVICSYNGARTLGQCLTKATQLRYPNYEVLVINDGSTDSTGELAAQFNVRLISTPNHGLSHARNIGWKKASGDIIAYLDDDAFPDPDWLTYLASSFLGSSHAAIGGPNIVPPDARFLEECVAHAPGNPVHVLLSDEEAEHIPGCNMAIRRSALEAIDGFDPQFRVAGDDVDLCWRIQERGWTIGFNPGAVVWHHRRDSWRAYWKQQVGYGKAEALLEAKWPEKYNCAGHATFSGRIYDKGITSLLCHTGRIYHGVWGSAPFQSLYERTPGPLLSLVRMPEWYLVLAFLSVLTALSLVWRPFWVAGPLLLGAASLSLAQVLVSTKHAWQGKARSSIGSKLQRRLAITVLHLIQPLARLTGRIKHGVTFWRRRGAPGFTFPKPAHFAHFSRNWQPAEHRLESIRQLLRSNRALVFCGGEFDSWDLEVAAGVFGGARLLMAIEEQGGGSQYLRFRVWPYIRPAGRLLLAGWLLLTILPALSGNWMLASTFGVFALATGLGTFFQAGGAIAAFHQALAEYDVKRTNSWPLVDWLGQLGRKRPERPVSQPVVVRLPRESEMELNSSTVERP